jgi:23S rRNA (uridine2552-2'-O)-methyltransferase
MRSRAAYKLIEIDDKARILRKGARVIDLGAAPGGWSQVAAERVGAPQHGKVIAIDVLSMEPVPGVDFVKLDFLDHTRQTQGNDGWACQRRAFRHGGKRDRSRPH